MRLGTTQIGVRTLTKGYTSANTIIEAGLLRRPGTCFPISEYIQTRSLTNEKTEGSSSPSALILPGTEPFTWCLSPVAKNHTPARNVLENIQASTILTPISRETTKLTPE